jgi:hypothetical protein
MHINAGSKLDYQLNEDWSYASYINTVVESTSSIPHETSKAQLRVMPPPGKVFRGVSISKFYFEIISSVFTSESSEWASEGTGYHVSASKAAEAGNSIITSEIPGTFGLQLNIYLDLSSSGLSTSRRLEQSTLLFFSSILGTFYGLQGTFGFIMGKTEEKWLEHAKKRKKAHRFSKRVQLLNSLMITFNRTPLQPQFLPLDSILSTQTSNRRSKTAVVVPCNTEELEELSADS